MSKRFCARSDSRRRVVLDLGGNVRGDSAGGYDRGLGLEIAVRPTSFVRIESSRVTSISSYAIPFD